MERKNSLHFFCLFCLLTNLAECVIIGGPLACARAEISIIPHPSKKVNRQFTQSLGPPRSRNCACCTKAQMSIDKPHKFIAVSLYNLPIVIPARLCYNINVPRERKSHRSRTFGRGLESVSRPIVVARAGRRKKLSRTY